MREQDANNEVQYTYYLTRILYLRLLGFIYFVAFLVAFQQNRGLLGKDGLLPAYAYFKRLRRRYPSSFEGFLNFPTILWVLDDEFIDDNLEHIALAGIVISALVATTGSSNSIVMLTLWLLYFSIDTVGQQFYSFGWESQLLETGFIAAFMVPLISTNRREATSRIAIYANWWLIFRIMIGAGLIKLRGDRCWIDLTCMNYHYETQPIPNPFSWYLHNNYNWFHKLETLGNHVVELVLPWLMFLPRPWRILNGIAQISFQLVLISSGNLSFLNWLTIVPSICFFDDQFLLNFPVFSLKTKQSVNADNYGSCKSGQFAFKRSLEYLYVLFVISASVPVIKNIMALDGYQVMNSSFGNFKLVNTYGAFGSITKKRTEVVVKGTLENPFSKKDAIWSEFEFKCKPGAVSRRPCLISPYHYRLDWLMWFAAFSKYQHHPWLIHLTVKLLEGGNPYVENLLASNPFNVSKPPQYIRADHYEYEFAPVQSKNWWTRKFKGTYFAPLSLSHPMVQRFVEKMKDNA